MHKNFILFLCLFILLGCSGSSEKKPASPQSEDPPSNTTKTTSRDNTPHVLVCSTGNKTIGNSLVTIDITNSREGYIMVKYLGSNNKVKFRIYNPNEKDPYTYDVKSGYNIYPLTGGNGTYKFVMYEHNVGNRYFISYNKTVSLSIKNDTTTYLYPNQYVNFNKDSKTVALGAKIAKDAKNDLDVVSKVYNYTIKNITYDYPKSKQAVSGAIKGYLPDVDEIIETKTGICFDYAAVMATMLRTQRIPTRLLIGYAQAGNGEVIYHAWISVYTKETGWIDNIIRFDGQHWSLMDPTSVAQDPTSDKIKEIVTDKNNYKEKYKY